MIGVASTVQYCLLRAVLLCIDPLPLGTGTRELNFYNALKIHRFIVAKITFRAKKYITSAPE